jgi:hypothetical protein
MMLRRDSLLVVVPKFELKAISESDASVELADKKPKKISLDFQIQHPVSKATLFELSEISINSTVLTSSSDTQTRHLFFSKVEEPIELPISTVLINLKWRRTDVGPTHQIYKMATGMIDLNEILQTN